MTKVYPNAARAAASVSEEIREKPAFSDGNSVVLTVWKKSLLPNCNGFTVFDDKGNLVFRVDNYTAGNKDEILLMDAVGKPLITIRRKRVILGDSWVVFEGEAKGKPLFTAKKRHGRCLAHVVNCKKERMGYEMEGSYRQRCCTVYEYYDDTIERKRAKVAEIKRKEAVAGGVAFGTDIFHLIIQQPHMDTTLAMAFVLLLDHMFGSS